MSPSLSRAGRARRRLALAAAALALAGCTAVLEPLRPESPQLYVLSPKSTFADGLPRVDWQLLVEPPVSAAGLDTFRIALRETPVTLDYYASVAWTDRAPQMVQTLLVESFENSGRIVSVGRESAGLRSDFLLQSELREFQAEYFGGEPRVRVGLNSKLISFPDREIIAGATFSHAVPFRDGSFDTVVTAFDEALGAVLKDTVEWALTEGQRHWRTRAAEPVALSPAAARR